MALRRTANIRRNRGERRYYFRRDPDERRLPGGSPTISPKPEVLERALKILKDTTRAPKMFVSTKEAFLAHISAILMMAGVEDFDANVFYVKHAGSVGNIILDLGAQVDDFWAHGVIDDALDFLGVEELDNE